MFLGGSWFCNGGRPKLEFLKVALDLGMAVDNTKPRKTIVGQVTLHRKPLDPWRGEAE